MKSEGGQEVGETIIEEHEIYLKLYEDAPAEIKWVVSRSFMAGSVATALLLAKMKTEEETEQFKNDLLKLNQQHQKPPTGFQSN